jgi:predicted short-subunit dehydrogenase-like oxidoreductase (DUF2520 family)
MRTARLPVRGAAFYLRHFCYISTSRWLGRFSFRLALHVAMEVGPYLHARSRQRVQRMASEDSVSSTVFPADCPHPTHFHGTARLGRNS